MFQHTYNKLFIYLFMVKQVRISIGTQFWRVFFLGGDEGEHMVYIYFFSLLKLIIDKHFGLLGPFFNWGLRKWPSLRACRSYVKLIINL
jgi:hypothetical protein